MSYEPLYLTEDSAQDSVFDDFLQLESRRRQIYGISLHLGICRMYASANGVDDRDMVCMHKSACAEVPIDLPGCVRRVCGIRSTVNPEYIYWELYAGGSGYFGVHSII